MSASELLQRWEPCKIHARLRRGQCTVALRPRFKEAHPLRWPGAGTYTRLATSIVVHLALSTVCMATRLRKSWSPGVNARRTSAGGPVSPREQKTRCDCTLARSEISVRAGAMRSQAATPHSVTLS